MGLPVDAQFRIDAKAAEEFARSYDPNPAHLMGGSNSYLPPGNVSGLYLVAAVMPHVVKSVPNLLCAGMMVVKWHQPILPGDYNVQITMSPSPARPKHALKASISGPLGGQSEKDSGLVATIEMKIRTD